MMQNARRALLDTHDLSAVNTAVEPPYFHEIPPYRLSAHPSPNS